MLEQKKRDLKRSGQDILTMHGIKDTKPVPIYTSGPIKIEMTTPQDLPLAVRPGEEGRKTRLSISLNNNWDGEIKKITKIWIAVPSGVKLDCNPEVSFFKPIEKTDFYSMKKEHLDRKVFKTFNCEITPTVEALDPVPITTKYIKIIVSYNYEISKSTKIRYQQGDAEETDLDDCKTVCEDYDGCYCKQDCKYKHVDKGKNCDGKTQAQIDKENKDDDDNTGTSNTGSSTGSDDPGAAGGTGDTGSTGGTSGSGVSILYTRSDFRNKIISAANKYSSSTVDAAELKLSALAIAEQESGTKHFRSDGFTYISGDYIGIMQIRPTVGKSLCGSIGIIKTSDLHDVDKNIECGAYIIKNYYLNYKDRTNSALIKAHCNDQSVIDKLASYTGWKAAYAAYNEWNCDSVGYVNGVIANGGIN